MHMQNVLGMSHKGFFSLGTQRNLLFGIFFSNVIFQE
jgi:hypothetical protein